MRIAMWLRKSLYASRHVDVRVVCVPRSTLGEPSHRFLLFFCSSRRSARPLQSDPSVSARRGGAPPPLAVPHALHGQPPVHELPTKQRRVTRHRLRPYLSVLWAKMGTIQKSKFDADRERIEKFLKLGISVRKIAKILKYPITSLSLPLSIGASSVMSSNTLSPG